MAKDSQGLGGAPLITCKLIRNETGDDGTFGRFYIGDSGPVFYSGELPWRENKAAISCVPPGFYGVKWVTTEKHPNGVYMLQNVFDRVACEIHKGNYCGDVEKGKQTDVEGCILLGLSKGVLQGQKAILRSTEAISQFEANLNGQDFYLDISEAYEPNNP